MRLTSINKAGVLAWCPISSHTDLLAVGSVAGSLDWRNDTTTGGSSNASGSGPVLEIYSMLPSITEKQISSLSSGEEQDQEENTAVQEQTQEEVKTTTTHDDDIFQSQHNDDFFSNSSTSDDFFNTLASTHHQNVLASTEEEEKRRLDAARKQPKLLAQIEAPDRFHRLTWGIPGSTGDSLGIVAGAQVDGVISLFDANKMVESFSKKKKILPSDEALIASMDKHQSSVRGLEFNPKQVNLLASAGDDGQLYIWNLKQPNQPQAVVLGCKNPHQNQTISHLQWNRKFEYILATTSHQGTSVVWDLKQKRVLVPFSNTAHPKSRYSSLAWNPDVHTQLLVACEDDDRPVIEVWDLRKAYAPIRELGAGQQGHQRGVLSVSWCPDDSNLLVSTGKDNRTLIWNPNTGDLLGELSSGFSQVSASNTRGGRTTNTFPQDEYQNWIFDAQWSYRSSLVSTCSFDKKIQVYAVQDASSVATGESDELTETVKKSNQNITQPAPAVLKTAPKWLKRPAGVSWCFGNRLITFSNTLKQESEEKSLEKNQSVQQYMSPNPISIYSGASAVASATFDESETEKLVNFNKQVIELEKVSLSQTSPQEKREISVQFCKEKQQMASKKQLIEWKLLEILFSSEEEKGSKIQALLGFNREELNQKSQSIETHPVETNRNDSEELSSLIKDNIIVGNIQGAIQCCLDGNRFADALLLSKVSGNSDMWSLALDQYLNSKEGSSIAKIKNLIFKNYDAVIGDDSLENWKEKLAILCSDMPKNKSLIDGILKSLIEKEEQRLIHQNEQSEEDTFGALVSSFLSGQIEQIFTRWISEFEKNVENIPTSSPSFALELIDLISKIELLHLHHVTSAAISKKTTTITYIESILNQLLQNGHVLNQLYITFAMKCVELGSLVDIQKTLPLALRYLNIALDQVSTQNSELVIPKEYSNVDIQELRYRLYHSIARVPPNIRAPSLPASWAPKKLQPLSKPAKSTTTSVASPVSTSQPTASTTTSTTTHTSPSTHSTRPESPSNRGYKRSEVKLLPQPMLGKNATSVLPPSMNPQPVVSHTTTTTANTFNPSIGGSSNLGGVATFTPQPFSGTTTTHMVPSSTTAGFNAPHMMSSNLGGVATFSPQPMVSGGGNTTLGSSTSFNPSLPSSGSSWQPVTNMPPMQETSLHHHQPMPVPTAQPVVDQQAILKENLEKYAGIDIERNVTGKNQALIDALTQCFDKLYGGEDKGAAHLDKKRMIAQSVNALFTLAQETTDEQLVNNLLLWTEQMLKSEYTNADHTFKHLQKDYFNQLKNAKNMRFLMTCLKTAKQ
ncbi:hypothetical protein C9374_004447 [Naegleria lovaniensis]|uniref:Guanine nucleotide-binding protein subunit beta-like protein n=1 Tax=Naegleria lovaniensis TaxID=51637 RepID=A0AA88GMK6_NAELO|nr:uncharacterized protein C9374_004447 [Naegleria lovaniensis]KAG2383110.1 hypothetical protein C9374_004447 [Naegleria lovaniensis]